MFKRFLANLVLALIVSMWGLATLATAPICQENTINISSSDTAVTFGGSFSHVIIKTSTSAAIVYVSPNNITASTTDFQIDPGSSLSYGLQGNMAAQTGFHYIGASATGTLSWMAY